MDPIELLILLSGALDLAASVADQAKPRDRKRILNQTSLTLAMAAAAMPTSDKPTADHVLAKARADIDRLETLCADIQLALPGRWPGH